MRIFTNCILFFLRLLGNLKTTKFSRKSKVFWEQQFCATFRNVETCSIPRGTAHVSVFQNMRNAKHAVFPREQCMFPFSKNKIAKHAVFPDVVFGALGSTTSDVAPSIDWEVPPLGALLLIQRVTTLCEGCPQKQ